MKENQNGKFNQQTESKPNQPLADNSQALLNDGSNSSSQVQKEVEENATFQRRPQFRLNENRRKRYI